VEGESQLKDVPAAAGALGLELIVVNADSESEIDAAFTALVSRKAGGLLVASDVFFASQRDRIITLAARHVLPAIYFQREYVTAGGLMSYGTDVKEMYRHAGIYAGHILKGRKPADLPVLQPTKFEFVINLKTAKALGLTIPPTLLALADEVIE
jgi:putative ABC transport system substrate-binding protein